MSAKRTPWAQDDPPKSPCTEVAGPIPKLNGATFPCRLHATHVFETGTNEDGIDIKAHRWGTRADGAWWYDREQVDEAERRTAREGETA